MVDKGQALTNSIYQNLEFPDKLLQETLKAL